MKTARRRSRELAVQAVYQSLINRTAAPEIAKTSAKCPTLPKRTKNCSTNFSSVRKPTQRTTSKNPPLLDRDEKDLNPIERAVLLTACHELSAMPETPYPVIINEAIEVTKTFGGTDGHKFVNGILDKLAAQIRPDEPKRR